MNLKGKSVIIAGGCEGFGKQLVDEFVESGPQVIVFDIVEEEKVYSKKQ